MFANGKKKRKSVDRATAKSNTGSSSKQQKQPNPSSAIRSANTFKLKHWNINLQRLCEDYHAAKAICWIDGATEGTDRPI